tara:strand:- start:73 stop:297 length:225 start_codon:yes stop_codon:yes gene_type:complete
MTEKELKEKYFEMEQKYLDERNLRGTEIVMNSKLREQIEALKLQNETLTQILNKYLKKYAKIKVYFDNLLIKDE